jgi:hypothetical protein
VTSISGEVDWQEVSVGLSAGAHTLEWKYIKDGAVSEGQDAAWLDDLSIDEGTTEVEFQYPPNTRLDLPTTYTTDTWISQNNEDANGAGFSAQAGQLLIPGHRTCSVRMILEVIHRR